MRFDWYQTEAVVVISFMTKNCTKEEATVDIQDGHITVIRKTGETEDKASINLHQSVDASKATHKFLSTKIEVKLPKKESGRWACLEKEKEAVKPIAAAGKDWDRIATAEVSEEKAEGDQAVNDLFKQIYGSADENTRRAMNKSFMESGGTVLSTDWSKVGAGKVDVKAPEGMEYKTYES